MRVVVCYDRMGCARVCEDGFERQKSCYEGREGGCYEGV